MVWELYSIGAELHYSLRHHLSEVLLPLSTKLASGRLRGGSSGICRKQHSSSAVLCIYLKGGSRTVILTAHAKSPSDIECWSSRLSYGVEEDSLLFVGRNSVVGTVVNASAVSLYRKACLLHQYSGWESIEVSTARQCPINSTMNVTIRSRTFVPIVSSKRIRKLYQTQGRWRHVKLAKTTSRDKSNNL
jgi:hypothetical protein